MTGGGCWGRWQGIWPGQEVPSAWFVAGPDDAGPNGPFFADPGFVLFVLAPFSHAALEPQGEP